MGVQIKTKINLDSNAYKRLIIREESGEYFVRVTRVRDVGKYEPTLCKLSNIMKKMNDSEKIITIVDSFLENTIISEIEKSVAFRGCSGNFIKVSGSRELYLQISNYDLLIKLVQMIKDKYDRDRCKFLLNNSFIKEYYITLNSGMSCYTKKSLSCQNCEYLNKCIDKIDCCPSSLHFRIMLVEGKIAPFEQRFMEKNIYDKLWEIGEIANIIEDFREIDDDTKVTNGYIISCGDLKVMFYCSSNSCEYIYEFCDKIVTRYNNEINERGKFKKKQLKMEGF